MQFQNVLALTSLVVACSTSFAQSPIDNRPLTRAEVRQSVLAANSAGQLEATGPAAEYAQPPAATSPPLSRSAVRQEVLAARAEGDLLPAGERYDAFVARSEATQASGLTRAEVVKATLRARDAGELLPAGQDDPAELARDRMQTLSARHARAQDKSGPSA
jgi:hypothetical protein